MTVINNKKGKKREKGKRVRDGRGGEGRGGGGFVGLKRYHNIGN